MPRYALIEDSLVVNVVICDSDEAATILFPDLTVIRVEGAESGPGWQYSDGAFTPPAVEPPSAEEVAAQNLATAQSEYDRASVHITALNEQIEDTDYDGTTEEAVKAELTVWMDYRKQLRAYIKGGDGSKTLPASPTV